MSYDVGRARRRLEVGRTAVVEDLDVRQLAHTWGGTCGTCGGATVRGTCGTCGTLEAGMRMAYVAALRLRYVRYAGGRYAYPVRTAWPRHSMATRNGGGTVWLPMSTRARTKSAGDRDALGVVPAHLEPGELHLHQQVVLPQLVRRQRVVREQVCALVTRAAAWWDMWRWARRT